MKDGKKVIVHKWIEQDLDLYNTFLDYPWMRELQARLPPQLAGAYDNLVVAWKEAANTHRLPWLMVHQMERFSASFMKRSKSGMAPLVKRLRDWLYKEMDGALKRVDKKAINAALKKLDQGLRLESQAKDWSIPAREYWNDLLGTTEFQISITGSQSLAYCALIFAYEWFVVSCLRQLGGLEKLRPSDDKFWNAYGKLLGGDPRATYWDNPPVRVARIARNSIVHEGGKAKPELLAEKHDLFISKEGVLTIQPSKNWALFKVLKEKVDLLVEEARVKLPPAGA